MVEPKRKSQKGIEMDRQDEGRGEALDPLDIFKLSGPWTEQDDIWLEHMTGEPQGKRRGTRDPGL